MNNNSFFNKSMVLSLMLVFVIFTQCINKQPLFSADSFKTKTYTHEEIMMFCDLAFSPDTEMLKKWEEDIRVEIKNTDEVTERDIANVDSCIAILAPLIYPLKMERVEFDGNLWVYTNTELYYPGDKGLGVTINKTPKHIREIKRMNIYEIKYLGTKQYLLHEFLHALGLWHAKRKYDFYINMLGYGSPPYDLKEGEFDYLLENRFPISEQEKEVIRMLYSFDFKSGYTRDEFLDEMNIRDEWERDIKK